MSTSTTKIQKVVLTGDYTAPHCPFCGTQTMIEGDAAGGKMIPCPHALFVATDEGFEYRSDRFDSLKGIHGAGNGDLDSGDDGYDGFTDDLVIANGIKFAMYAPAPSFFGSYFGFAPLD